METAQERFARDWSAQQGDRKLRGWDQRSQERKDREYYPHNDDGVPDDVYALTYTENY